MPHHREPALTAKPISFDQQAPSFDNRTGLTEPVAAQVAKAVCELAEIDQTTRLLEIGAGTGEIGVSLALHSGRYIGLDESQGMLDEFKKRLGPGDTAQLLRQDANQPWAVEHQWAHAIFGSRVFHLLDPEHLVGQVIRAARTNKAIFLVGRVKRDPASVKSQMRSKMRQLLAERGLAPRQTNRRLKELVTRLNHYGAILEPTTAASWETKAKPADSIRGWEGKAAMGGIVPPDQDKQIILEELRSWAAKRFGDPHESIASQEHYVLEGVHLTIR